ncbi:hypothetical protein G6F42_017586 [Rhizopus arrhizus]|nr:hypothetical protein G6F42_017586 [Rhizopus arrhizus]
MCPSHWCWLLSWTKTTLWCSLSPASKLSGAGISFDTRLSGARSAILSGFVFKVVSPLFEALCFSEMVSALVSLHLVLLLHLRCSEKISRQLKVMNSIIMVLDTTRMTSDNERIIVLDANGIGSAGGLR